MIAWFQSKQNTNYLEVMRQINTTMIGKFSCRLNNSVGKIERGLNSCIYSNFIPINHPFIFHSIMSLTRARACMHALPQMHTNRFNFDSQDQQKKKKKKCSSSQWAYFSHWSLYLIAFLTVKTKSNQDIGPKWFILLSTILTTSPTNQLLNNLFYLSAYKGLRIKMK